jgi:ABC-type branched-subunit amino acid transport system substrate-binding protein
LLPPQPLPSSPANWSAIFRQILSNQPNAVLLWLEPSSAASVALELRQTGYTGLLAGSIFLGDPTFSREAGRAAEGFIVPWITYEPEVRTVSQEFQTEYKRRYSGAPSILATFAYDAAQLCLRMQLARDRPGNSLLFSTFAGASGWLDFDAAGNRSVRLELFVCHDGKFRPIRKALTSESAQNLTLPSP